MKKSGRNSSFSVGDTLLVAQRRQIIAMINLLLSNYKVTVYSETVSDILTKMTIYAEEHFQTEEMILEEQGYPDLAHHKEEHRAYRIKVVSLCHDTMNHRDSVPEDLLIFLRDWWAHHILETDVKSRSFLLARNAV